MENLMALLETEGMFFLTYHTQENCELAERKIMFQMSSSVVPLRGFQILT